ncbi:hypothetical protein OG413_14090 [Streptomyces sp. NBC_01433]|uniref:hypothetical protein n=1 Tax=Streptomyces sp. NBC_01433 TaxID=2903864 RepID=UPI00224D8A56|nr:hypothetical protein [Streptomyces sp. NBC_01433]MCX4676421.1 hypothetical protein [Streptomyces sp. NBC_01433]
MGGSSESEIPPEGRFVLHRFNGDEVYRFHSAVMFVVDEPDSGTACGPTLWFEVAGDHDAVQRCEDTASSGMAPYAEVGVELPAAGVEAVAEADRLVGRTFLMPGAMDGEDSAMSLFYYYDNEPLWDSRITVLSRAGDRFRLRWTAVCEDVNFYDGSTPATEVEIEGEFRFKVLEQWAASPRPT